MNTLSEAIQLVNQAGYEVGSTGLMNCPFHRDSNPSGHIWWNYDHNQAEYKCFSPSCGISISFKKFYRRLTGLPVQLVAKSPSIPRSNSLVGLRGLVDALHNSFRSSGSHIGERKEALAYLIRRGMTKETVKDYKIGFVTKEYLKRYPLTRSCKWYREKGREYFLSFPIIDELGRIINVQFEDHKNKSVKPNKFFLPHLPKGIWYSEIPVDKTKSWIVTESIWDSLSARMSGPFLSLSTLGIPSSAQVEKLREFEGLVFCLDNDLAGQDTSKRLLESLSSQVSIAQVKFPDGIKDLNELLVKEGLDSVKTLFDSYRVKK